MSNSPSPADSTSVPKIIFLNYMARSGSDNSGIKIEFINKTISTGRFKMSAFQGTEQKPGDLLCILLDGQMRPTDSLPVPDPLNISVESVGDNSALFRKEIALDSAEFTVRMQLKPDTKAVALRKKSGQKSDPYLIVTIITEP